MMLANEEGWELFVTWSWKTWRRPAKSLGRDANCWKETRNKNSIEKNPSDDESRMVSGAHPLSRSEPELRISTLQVVIIPSHDFSAYIPYGSELTIQWIGWNGEKSTGTPDISREHLWFQVILSPKPTHGTMVFPSLFAWTSSLFAWPVRIDDVRTWPPWLPKHP